MLSIWMMGVQKGLRESMIGKDSQVGRRRVIYIIVRGWIVEEENMRGKIKEGKIALST